MNDATIQITECSCTRATYHVRGVCPEGTGLEEQLYFQERESKEQYMPTAVFQNRDTFELLVNTESMDNQYPWKSGSYVLCSDDGPVGAADRLRDELLGNRHPEIEIYKNRHHFLSAASGISEKDGGFEINVRSALPSDRRYYAPGEKHSLRSDLTGALKTVAEGGYRLIFSFFDCLVKKNGHRIFITSGSRAGLSGNEKFVYDCMIRRGLDANYTFRFSFKPSIRARMPLFRLLKFIYYQATSDIIIVDDYYPEICRVNYRPEVRIIQLWHACGAFKTVGLERMDKTGAPPINSREHKCYTLVPVSSELSARHCQEAFGIDYKKFYPVGIPRTDIFFDEVYAGKVNDQLHRDYPELTKASKVILYAPTFRGKTGSSVDADFPFEYLFVDQLGKFCREHNYCMLIKMHPFVKKKLRIPWKYRHCLIDVSGSREVNDLLFAADVLVTDYSSVMYEYSLLHRPMYFYAFDLEDYIRDRDFYEPYEDTVPGPIVTKFRDLLTVLESGAFDEERLETFVRRNFAYTDGRSTDRVVDLIIGNEEIE